MSKRFGPLASRARPRSRLHFPFRLWNRLKRSVNSERMRRPSLCSPGRKVMSGSFCPLALSTGQLSHSQQCPNECAHFFLSALKRSIEGKSAIGVLLHVIPNVLKNGRRCTKSVYKGRCGSPVLRRFCCSKREVPVLPPDHFPSVHSGREKSELNDVRIGSR